MQHNIWIHPIGVPSSVGLSKVIEGGGGGEGLGGGGQRRGKKHVCSQGRPSHLVLRCLKWETGRKWGLDGKAADGWCLKRWRCGHQWAAPKTSHPPSPCCRAESSIFSVLLWACIQLSQWKPLSLSWDFHTDHLQMTDCMSLAVLQGLQMHSVKSKGKKPGLLLAWGPTHGSRKFHLSAARLPFLCQAHVRQHHVKPLNSPFGVFLSKKKKCRF